jgi:hypothetical protein
MTKEEVRGTTLAYLAGSRSKFKIKKAVFYVPTRQRPLNFQHLQLLVTLVSEILFVSSSSVGTSH